MLPVSSILFPSCQSGSSGGPSNQGTAPGPTPTPAPLSEDRDPAEVAAELSGYLSHVKPAADHLWFWNEWFNAAWPKAETAEGQAALLHQFGNRLAQACAAFAAVQNIPLEAAGINTLISEAARARHAWVEAAVEKLQCCGKVTDPDIASGNASTSRAVAAVLPEISGFAGDFGAAAGAGYTLNDAVLGIDVTVPAGWLSAADGLTLVFVAPVQFQSAGLAGLGPESWQTGAGVRVRRLRNPGQLSPAEASDQFIGLVTRQGSVESTSDVELSGLPALRHELSTGMPEWSATMTVTMAGDFTYFIETGCVTLVNGSCDEVDRLVDALVITS